MEFHTSRQRLSPIKMKWMYSSVWQHLQTHPQNTLRQSIMEHLERRNHHLFLAFPFRAFSLLDLAKHYRTRSISHAKWGPPWNMNLGVPSLSLAPSLPQPSDRRDETRWNGEAREETRRTDRSRAMLFTINLWFQLQGWISRKGTESRSPMALWRGDVRTHFFLGHLIWWEGLNHFDNLNFCSVPFATGQKDISECRLFPWATNCKQYAQSGVNTELPQRCSVLKINNKNDSNDKCVARIMKKIDSSPQLYGALLSTPLPTAAGCLCQQKTFINLLDYTLPAPKDIQR